MPNAGIEQDKTYYVKSLEEDFATKTLKGRKKKICQTIQDIVKTKTIKPNTLSFGRKKRLSCTIIHKNYTKTYRPHGIIFQTPEKPSQIFPFDMGLLISSDKIIVKYYRIKDSLDVYYNHKLIDGFEEFIFWDFHKLIKKISSPSIAWKKANEFRQAHGFKCLPNSKRRLAEYNEAIFNKKIRIKPIALIGYRKETRKIAKELKLPYFASARQFFKSAASKK